MLQISNCLSALRVRDKVNFTLSAPASWDSTWKCINFVQLFVDQTQKLRFVLSLILTVLSLEMLLSVYYFSKLNIFSFN